MEWTDFAFLTGTIERKRFLEEKINSPDETEASMLKHFLRPPLYSTNFKKSFGTLYTIIYRVAKGELEIHWPDVNLTQDFTDFKETRIVPFSSSSRKGLVS